MKGLPGKEDYTYGVLLPSALTESFEIVLARISDLHHSGKKVKAIVCKGRVKGCVTNPIGFKRICQHCCFVSAKALSDSATTVEVISLDDYYAGSSKPISLSDSKSLEAGALSTVLTFYRFNPESVISQPIRGWIYRRLAHRFYLHSQFVYVAMARLMSQVKIDCLEFFNGRIVPTRGALLAASQVGQNFSVLEVSGRERRLTIVENNSVHDLYYKQEELRSFLARCDLDIEAGVGFFESRRNGEETNDKSFTSRQKKGFVQTRNRPLLAIFTSSADELKVAGEQWFTSASLDPITFIIDLANLLKKDFDIVVRMHPNQAGDKTGAARKMVDVLSKVSFIELIPPTSWVSSYELLDAAQIVLTFGSTIGLEATYHSKPSILAGHALWENQDIAYMVDTPEEVAVLVGTSLLPRSREAAIKVGAYYNTGTGIPSSLKWRQNGLTGFSVNDYNYINLKRASCYYWVTRIIDRLLRLL